MEQEAAAIEHDLRHAGLLGALGERLADGRGAVAGGAGLALKSLSSVEAAASVLPAASSMTCA